LGQESTSLCEGDHAARKNESEEGPAVKQRKRKQNTMSYLKSEGNLALADAGLTVLQKPEDKTLSPVLDRVQDITEEYPDVDTLSPAVGIIGGIGLSVLLWCLIVLVIYWIV
jgi:hypothetical protein